MGLQDMRPGLAGQCAAAEATAVGVLQHKHQSSAGRAAVIGLRSSRMPHVVVHMLRHLPTMLLCLSCRGLLLRSSRTLHEWLIC
jgi:hypothetical protein